MHIAVIGTGIVGACSAAWLQRDGHQITFVDPLEPGEACRLAQDGDGLTVALFSRQPLEVDRATDHGPADRRTELRSILEAEASRRIVVLVAMLTAMLALVVLPPAKADDKAAFDAALASTAASCKGCHDSYQVPPPAKPG